VDQADIPGATAVTRKYPRMRRKGIAVDVAEPSHRWSCQDGSCEPAVLLLTFWLTGAFLRLLGKGRPCWEGPFAHVGSHN
jgi:aminoglycoside phosphotransferase (APT) family kinase protein